MTSPFQMPTTSSITGRTSSITNAFINAIIPVVFPSEGEVLEALNILHMSPEDVRCAYCGDKATEWDHLRPLVTNRRPTGYISEIANLVPSCGKCNQSKGNKPWMKWITSMAPQSPYVRQIPDLQGKIDRLSDYERWKDVQPLDFEQLIGSELWERHWQNWQRVLDDMKESQNLAIEIRAKIRLAQTI